MDSATHHMIQAIDRRIEKLSHIRAMLVEEFGDDAPSVNGAHAHRLPVPKKTRPPAGVNRKDELYAWLKEHGPATRGDIIQGTGIPKGTIGAYLSAEDRFVNREGKWHAV